MVEVMVKEKALEEPFKIEDIIILEELPPIEWEFEVVKVKAEEKPIKRALSKLLKKARYNAKYLEEVFTVDKVKRNIYYRNYGLL